MRDLLYITEGVFTLHTWKAFAPAPYRIGHLVTRKNGDFGAIPVTERGRSREESLVGSVQDILGFQPCDKAAMLAIKNFLEEFT